MCAHMSVFCAVLSPGLDAGEVEKEHPLEEVWMPHQQSSPSKVLNGGKQQVKSALGAFNLPGLDEIWKQVFVTSLQVHVNEEGGVQLQ